MDAEHSERRAIKNKSKAVNSAVWCETPYGANESYQFFRPALLLAQFRRLLLCLL